MTGLTLPQISTRYEWVENLENATTSFTVTSASTLRALEDEIRVNGADALLSHIRFCGNIPEHYAHDSTAEKAYSKYTDAVVAEALRFIGMNAIVVEGRADMADVEADANDFSLVADAKAFRLTRTAKNQKDFKVTSMDRWRYDRDYALVIAPIDHLPITNSQIYFDASNRNVCILTWSHLAALVQAKVAFGSNFAQSLLHQILKEPRKIPPSKSAIAYWRAINQAMTDYDQQMADIWAEEKLANYQVLELLKKDALEYLRSEKSRIAHLSREDAIQILLDSSKVFSRMEIVSDKSISALFDI